MSHVEYRNLGHDRLTRIQKDVLEGAGWVLTMNTWVRRGLSLEQAEEEFESLTGKNLQDYCEICGPSHFMEEYEDGFGFAGGV